MSDQHQADGPDTPGGRSAGSVPVESKAPSPRRSSPAPGRQRTTALTAASVEEHLTAGASAAGSGTPRAGGPGDGGSSGGDGAATAATRPSGRPTASEARGRGREAHSGGARGSATSGTSTSPGDTSNAAENAAKTSRKTARSGTSGTAAAGSSEQRDTGRSDTSGASPTAETLTARTGLARRFGRLPTVSSNGPTAEAGVWAVADPGPGHDLATTRTAAASPNRHPTDDTRFPGRPKKPILAGAAMAGAILITAPLLLMAIGSDDDRKQNAAASNSNDTVLEDDGAPAGAFAAQSPTPTPTQSGKKTSTSPNKSADPAASPSPEAQNRAPEPADELEKKGTKAARAARSTGLPTVLTRVLIKNNTNRTCVDIPGYSSGTSDGPVIQSQCNNHTDDNQLWNAVKKYKSAGPGGAPLFVIRNVMDSMCLDLPNYGAAKSGTKVTEHACRGTTADNQLWWLDRRADGHYWIRNYASNNACLDSYGPDAKRRTLIIWPCAPEKLNNHEWIFTRG